MRVVLLGCLMVFGIAALMVDETDAWSGHTITVRYLWGYRSVRKCVRYFKWWGCSKWRTYSYPVYHYVTRCSSGWTHNGNRVCTIPICRPYCANGGTCSRPNVCDCPSTSTGIGCRQLTCSYKRPCYPGECNDDQTCTCEEGFRSENEADGCIIFEEGLLVGSNSTLAPIIGKSTVTLANVRREDSVVNFMFTLEGSETEFIDIVWSNQIRFNNLKFELESLFVPPDISDRQAYVHDAALGVVHSQIEANLTKTPFGGGPIRDPGSFKTYVCDSGFSKDNPALEMAECEINDEQFNTRIDHGDWLTITFQTTSGGFQKIIDLDNHGAHYATKYYRGLKDIKQVEFKFDFRAPKHCSEDDAYTPNACPPDSHILRVEEEFTKNPIRATWLGWQDDLSGVLEYYMEVFKLGPDPYDRLVEMTPVDPEFSATIQHNNITYPQYRPSQPGMYSVLVETRDISNNSRISRRLVLYDDDSEIELSDETDRKLFISSAVAETGYKWQTSTVNTSTRFVVNWDNHFINQVHFDGKLLNEVLDYPIQFEDIEADGILFSKKFVQDSLDDNEGQRTKNPIDNFNGIVKFEIAKVYTKTENEPTVGWEEISPLTQANSFTEQLDNGARLRVWIRASDIIGNVATDSTLVRVDSTPPVVSNTTTPGVEHGVTLNLKQGRFNYTSRISCLARDDQSGVHKLGYNIIIHTPNKPDRIVFSNSTAASMGTVGNPLCRMVDDQCFLVQQQLEVNNCWFLIPKNDLDTSTTTVEVTAYNQALLQTSTMFKIGTVKQLDGLQEYSGPRNMRVEKLTDRGFRIAWDLPEQPSCYGVADIIILLTVNTPEGPKVVQTIVALGTERYRDVLGLDPLTEYGLSLGLRVPGGEMVQDTGEKLSVVTQKPVVTDDGVSVGLIVGIVVGLLVLMALAVVTLFVLARKGYIKPAEKAHQIRRAVSTKYRKTVAGGRGRQHANKKTYAYDNRQSELYIYGGMDDGPQIWHLERNDVVFESLIKSGHFANIYHAKLKRDKTSVVAKTLKEGYSADDEVLMKAKLNFSGTVVGDHPNVLKFVGAVVGDQAMGPFIIYEYCEKGTLKEYVEQNKSNVTLEVQDNFYRFGLDIAKGMEFLAGRGVIHRRLAARNILLTFLNEVKIAGFGPQPDEDEGGPSADQNKKERIPIKWMAPESMSSTKDADEKSDVWSYAVVLWEIFSLGENPYANIRSRDLASRLKKGERLAKPEYCDDTWYDVMRKCWSHDASKRPTFTVIRDELDTMFVSSADDMYYYQR